MKTLRINTKGLHEFAKIRDFLVSQKRNFEISQTSYTAKLQYELNSKRVSEFFFDDHMRKSDFFMMMKLRKVIKSNSDKISKLDRDGIKYCVYNYHLLKPNSVFYPVTEIDISSAYVYCAKNLGLIDDQIFGKMIKMDKLKRLKMLGSIATKTIVTEYEKGRQVDIYQKEDDILRNCWFTIVKQIDYILLEISQKYNNFLFYYVDGVYICGIQNQIEICEYLNSLGYEFKVKSNLKLKVGKTGNVKVIDPKGSERIFTISKSNFKKWVTI